MHSQIHEEYGLPIISSILFEPQLYDFPEPTLSNPRQLDEKVASLIVTKLTKMEILNHILPDFAQRSQMRDFVVF